MWDGGARDPHVPCAIAPAWFWRRPLETGSVSTIQVIAAAETVSDRFVSRILRRAYVSPEVLDHLVIWRSSFVASSRSASTIRRG